MEMILKLAALAVLVTFASCQYGDGTVAAEFEVLCNDTYMVVVFNKTAIDERNTASHIRPFNINFWNKEGDAACSANETSTDFISTTDVDTTFGSDHIYLQAMYPSDCGMNEIQDDDYIIYNASVVITYGRTNNPDANIRREEYDVYNVMCLRNRTNYEMITGTEKVQVQLRTEGFEAKNDTAEWNFTFDHFNSADSQNNGGIPYKLGELITFKLDFVTSISTLKQKVNKCWATSDGSSNEYVLIEDRCAKDAGTTLTQSDGAPKATSFTVEAFKYTNDGNNEFHVSCLVYVCQTSNTANECADCGSRKRRSLNGDNTGSELELVRSPVIYIVDDRQSTSTSGSQESSPSVLSGTTGVIVIVLLALLVLIIAIAVIKKMFFTPAVIAVPNNIAMKGYDNNGMA